MERPSCRRQCQAARKRVSADVILRDAHGRILLVDPKYKPDWDLPGGMAEANEPPADAVRRELRKNSGSTSTSATCFASIGSHRTAHGTISSISSLMAVSLTSEPLPVCVSWMTSYGHMSSSTGTGQRTLAALVWRRVRAALEASTTGRARYLQDGYVKQYGCPARSRGQFLMRQGDVFHAGRRTRARSSHYSRPRTAGGTRCG